MLENNRYLNDFSKVDWDEKICSLLAIMTRPLIEIGYGLLANAVPLHWCFMWGSFTQLLIVTHLDRKLLNLSGAGVLYPTYPPFYWLYWFCAATSGFWFWGLRQTYLRRSLIERLTDVFKNSGLQNALGKFPAFICDRPIDDFTRKLKLTRASLSKNDFEKAKDNLASSLHVYIDEIREIRETGTIEIIYSQVPMPELTMLEEVEEIAENCFVIGRTRARQLIASLSQVPHLLVAGLTGGGKSTFLRALITVLFIRNKDYEFTLIDLKGGLEFQTFENLDRVKVIPSIEKAIPSLEELQNKLEARMKILKDFGCKDIQAYFKLFKTATVNKAKFVALNRHIIVVDEIAELFLNGAGVDNRKIQKARRILSQIARQGRSVGIHLVAATQRPDSRALDPQVKANLTGVLCFQMLNDASSITVLGNGRATELPAIAGRAIWKNGADMQEVQVPFLGVDQADEMLAAFRKKSVEPSNSGANQNEQVQEREKEELSQTESVQRNA